MYFFQNNVEGFNESKNIVRLMRFRTKYDDI